jgi:hypothetical protein
VDDLEGLPEPSLEEYLSKVPSDEETARRAVEPYRHLTPAERWAAFAELLREMETLSAGRPGARSPDDENFWRHWKDPSLGRPV